MKLSPTWIREFVDLKVDNHQLAHDLTSIGIAVEGITGEGDRMVYETEIGTNRPDAMNHYGVAREASALYNVALKPIEPKLPTPKAGADFPIQVEEPELCPRFTVRAVCNVSIKPSPAKIADRLSLLDSRPISNAVDASNYVLMEMGKPTHAFDMDLLEGGKIVVRKARPGETLKTLDGVDRKLTTDDLVVADARRPVGLAGVMGGFDTMITEKTKNILIESAWWDPATIRRSSKRHMLHTDASHRFERGADFESTILSCDRVAELILGTAGGELHGNVVDVVSKKLDQAPIALHLGEVRRILGAGPTTNEIIRILRALGFSVIPEQGPDEFTVHIPSWRLDVEREIDVVEEIARGYGYDKFANTLPSFAGSVVELPHAGKDAKLRSTLLSLGYNEVVSLTFISHHDAETFAPVPALELANPLSEEASVMRTSLVPGMLGMIAYNLNRGTDDVRLFEAGNGFETAQGKSAEAKRVCLAATESALKKQLPQGAILDVSKGENAAAAEVFRSFTGDVEQLLGAFQCESLTFDAKTSDYYHPGRSARVLLDGAAVAQFGQLLPDVAAERKLRQNVFVAELYLDKLYAHPLREILYRPIPRYPAVERDFSFLFSDQVNFGQIESAVRGLHLSDLRTFAPVEIFRGGAVAAGSYSILLRATFQSADRTLRDDEVAQWAAQVVNALTALGGTQRA
jgi:phenylalanyl-tRNA synthetase beta chain